MSSRRGMVLTLNLEPSPSGDMDWESEPPSRKRTLDDVSSEDDQATPAIMGAPAPTSSLENAEPEEKKTRSTASETTETQEALLQLKDEPPVDPQ